MQENLPSPLTNQKYPWLDTAETMSLVGSIGGAVASVVFQQVAVAAIPLSVSVMLNLMNRRQLLESMKQNHFAAIAQIIQDNAKTQNRIESHQEQLAEFEQMSAKKHAELHAGFSLLDDQIQQVSTNFDSVDEQNQKAIAQLVQEDVETQTQLVRLNEGLEQLQQQTNKLVQEQNSRLLNEQAKIARTVDALREIETCTQSIRINPVSSANAFFNRGLSYQRLGDREAAIGDYSEAIRVNPQYAEAFQSRGLAYAELGDKKTAVKDLREAARLFFESGEIDKYQIARDLSKKFHELDMPSEDDTDADGEYEAPEAIALDSLFS
jgi:tetratricopeptide (TPR) repeat protein